MKFYLSLAAVTFVCFAANAQNSQLSKHVIHSHIAEMEYPQDTKIDYTTTTEKNSVYTNDFSNPADWNIFSEGDQGNWAVVTEQNADVLQFMGAMASATADNGFGEFNGISFLLDGDVELQNAILELNDVVDCSDLSDVAVTFNQRARKFNYDIHYLEVSVDEGSSWTPFEVNADLVTNEPSIQGELTVDISAIAIGQPDVRIRFRWESDPLSQNPALTEEQINSFGSGYGWMVDDLNISSLPENELIIGETFYGRHFEIFFEQGGEFFTVADYTDLGQVNAFEYHTQPDFTTRPFDFACGVTNGGSLQQTGVQLEVTLTDPAGTVETLTSDPITIDPGVTDTLRLYDQVPANWLVNGAGLEELQEGIYEINFEVLQTEEDELPGNNVGVSLFTRVSNGTSANGRIFQHENSTTQVGVDGQDIITGTRYSFTESDAERIITGIRFALNDESIDAEGEEIFFNVRKGGVLDEESAENPMELVFDEDQVAYVVVEEDLSTTSTPNWIEVELPTPVMIEPNRIHQAEILIPAFGEELVFVGTTSTRKVSSSVLFDFEDPSTGPQEWYFLPGSVYNIAFVTDAILDVEEISYESGIKLGQNYPNPVIDNTSIQFQLDETSYVTFQLFDINGRLVHQENIGLVGALDVRTIDLDGSEFAAGTYTYTIATENDKLSRKMTIVK